MIPSRDHTGLPIHFHSSIISRSASRMLLRMPANVLPRQSVSSAISWSIRSDGFIGSLCLEFLSLDSPRQKFVTYIPLEKNRFLAGAQCQVQAPYHELQ